MKKKFHKTSFKEKAEYILICAIIPVAWVIDKARRAGKSLHLNRRKALAGALAVAMMFTMMPVMSFATLAADDTPLTFTAETAGSTVTLNYKSGSDVMYKLGSDEWTDYTKGTAITLTNANDTVRFKGTGVTTDSGNHFSMTGKIAASGDVTSLTNGVGGDATLTDNCYIYMFNGCASLTTAPELPSTVLDWYCYFYMFQGCTSLEAAPTLPATTMTNCCYYGMFRGCTSLTTAPALPATTLADNCYFLMFSDCTSLEGAPVLPATALASSCYSSMFRNCSSLTAAPELRATALTNSCYYGMFFGCTSLTTAPELPATTLAVSCYNGIFSGCTSLTAPPELPATELASSCYSYMFNGCKSLRVSATQTGNYTKAWSIPSTGTISTTLTGWNTAMFTGSGGPFTDNPSLNTTYYYFYEDITPPVISGIENGKTYCEKVEFTVTDADLDTVKVNGSTVTAVNGTYKLNTAGVNTVVATDQIGNSTTVTVTLKANHVWDTEWSVDGESHWHECSACGAKRDLAAHTPNADDGDCTTAVYCPVCNTVTTAAKVHDFSGSYDGYDANGHWHICRNEGCNAIDEKEAHTGGTATYFNQAVCTACDQKYGSTTQDVTAPTGEICISENRWNEFLNTVTFGLFFKETKTVTIIAVDTESGIAKIEYLLSDTVFNSENAVTGTWNDITVAKQFNLNEKTKQYIYARLTDEDGNTAMINSAGVVVYSDSTVSPATATFDKNVDYQDDIAFTVTLNGNTLKDIQNGATALIAGTDYNVSGNTVTVKKAYFAAQENGTVTLTFSFYPMGVENNDNLSVTTAVIAVCDTTHYHSMSHTAYNAATCTENGNAEYWYCSGCQKYFSDGNGDTEITLASTVISKLGHNFYHYESNDDATCTEDGTRTATCDRCGATDTIPDTGSTLGHSFTNYLSNNDATCTEDGTKTATCDHAGCGETDTIPDVGSALGHNFIYLSNNDATCTEDGTKTVTCDRCGETDTMADPGSARGHSFTEYMSDGNATCTEDGTKTARCNNMGCADTDTMADPGSALGHSFTYYASDGNATCTEDGTKTAMCNHAGCGETVTIPNTGSALGHRFTDYLSNNDATCTENGTRTARCNRSGCGETDTIPDPRSALGHSFTNYLSNNNATCTEDGTKTATCDRCVETDTIIDIDTKLGHDFTGAYDGHNSTFHWHICNHENCQVIDPPVSHSWGDTVIEKRPTATEAGFFTCTCEGCGAERKTLIPPTAIRDIEPNSYYEEAVYWAISSQITYGTSSTTFSPNKTLSRAEMVTYIWRMAGSPEPESNVSIFHDVTNANLYYYKAVTWACEKKLVYGTDANTFSPDQICTREQIVTVLWRLTGSQNATISSTSFKDVDTGAYYYQALLWATENGIVGGTSNTTFSPKAYCTRAQMACFLFRLEG